MICDGWLCVTNVEIPEAAPHCSNCAKNIVGPWLLAAQAKQPELGFPEEDLTAVQCSSWVMILFCEGKKRRRTCMHYSCKKCLINNELHTLRPQRDERIENSLSLRFSWKFRHPMTTSFAAPARTQTWHIRVQLHQGAEAHQDETYSNRM